MPLFSAQTIRLKDEAIMKTLKGFTLCELLCTLSIVAILTSVGIPSLSNLLDSIRSQDLYHQLFTLIQYSRSRAAFLAADVILCPSTNNKNCINNWQLPLIIFVDKNSNKIRDEDEVIDYTVDFLKKEETLTWRASGTSRYLRYISDGSTASQNGSFRLCPSNKKLENIKKIIIYRSGRARKALKKEITGEDCN
ncbi:MAG: type IV fimbrial biogenesis protein FimT [Candidatus Endobugula sp.]